MLPFFSSPVALSEPFKLLFGMDSKPRNKLQLKPHGSLIKVPQLPYQIKDENK